MTNNNFDKIISQSSRLARKFHDKSKIKTFGQLQAFSKRKIDSRPEEISYKAYPRFKQVILPNPRIKKYDLIQTFIRRESIRDFATATIPLFQLSDLLYYSAGSRNFIVNDNSIKRFYPSAGARYPLEVYPFIFNVERIDSAVYHYHVKTHSLELVLERPFASQTFKQFDQEWIKKVAALIVFTAIFDRTESKYGDRGYRHILTEYGHVAQNMYLISAALDIGCCTIGGFIDDGLNTVLDIDGFNESVVGVIAIGVSSVEYSIC